MVLLLGGSRNFQLDTPTQFFGVSPPPRVTLFHGGESWLKRNGEKRWIVVCWYSSPNIYQALNENVKFNIYLNYPQTKFNFTMVLEMVKVDHGMLVFFTKYLSGTQWKCEVKHLLKLPLDQV